MNVKIRKATPEDAAPVAHIHQQAIDDGDAFIQEPSEFVYDVEEKRKFIERLNAAPQSVMLVAELDGKVTGWLFLQEHEHKKLRHVVMLGMAIDRNRRGQGIGKALLREAVRWARTRDGIGKITLAALEKNTAAIRLYQAAGFEIEGVEKDEVRYADGSFGNMVLMGLRL